MTMIHAFCDINEIDYEDKEDKGKLTFDLRMLRYSVQETSTWESVPQNKSS